MATQEFAADDRSNGNDVKDVVAYIMPQRIQKKMLQDLKNAVKRSSLHVCETYGETVSHIVTQYEDREQVMRQLKRDGAEFKDEGCMDRLKVVKLAWLSLCLKAGRFVEVEDKHMVKCSHASQDALEILEKHAEFRNESSDYSRALAFRRASCVLKSLPYRVERLCQVEGLKDVGGHALKVIQSILEEGVCEEVQQITNDWFFLMKEFTSVFGVGPATAKKWIDRGWRTVEEVRKSGNVSKDERVMWGLAFHEDLTSPVSLAEANTFLQMVKTEAENILPGIIVTLTGGFRRGKKSGHDVDILLSHPSEGEELGLLPTLLQALDRKGIVLMGRLEVSTFTPDCLTSDSKLVAMRGQLDHFEKWLGICKFENADEVTIDQEVLKTAAGPIQKSSDTHAVKSDTTEFQADPEPSTDGADNSTTKTNGNVHQNSMQDVDKKKPSDKHVDASCKPASKSHDERKHKALGDSEPEPKLKHKKTKDKHQFPLELARSERNWKARRVDLIVTPYSQYYYALVGWTGNKHFNRDLRLYAQKECNMKLTSHGLWDFEKQRAVPARSEAEVFDNLKVVYRDPGHNGLIAAAYLQKSGQKVCVLERRHVVGGAAVTEELVPGFKFSRASYVLSLLRPQIMKDLELKKYGLKVYLRDPSSYTPLLEPGGKNGKARSLLLGRNHEENVKQIAQFSDKDAQAFGTYESQLDHIVSAISPLLDNPPLSITNSGRSSFQHFKALFQSALVLTRAASKLGKDLPAFYEFMTAPGQKVLNRWFESEPLRATLATDSVIGAMTSPLIAGSAYVLLHHVMGELEGVKGAWGYVEGGMGQVSAAIARCAQDHGADVFCDKPVTQIKTKGEKVTGVVLEDGSEVSAKVVLSNATPRITYLHLLQQGVLPAELARSLEHFDFTSPVTKINVAVDRIPNFLADPNVRDNEPMPHHRGTIHLNCEDSALIHEAYLDAQRGQLPSKPMIEIVIPSSLDPTVAPSGKHVVLLFTQYTPYTLADGRTWDNDTRNLYADTVFDTIEQYAPGFKNSVIDRDILSPPDLERIFGLTGGNIFHGAMSLDQLYLSRPNPLMADYRCPVAGLYLCGSGAHPGGGVMGSAGRLAAQAVLEDLPRL